MTVKWYRDLYLTHYINKVIVLLYCIVSTSLHMVGEMKALFFYVCLFVCNRKIQIFRLGISVWEECLPFDLYTTPSPF